MAFTEESLSAQLDSLRSAFNDHHLEVSQFVPENNHLKFDQPDHLMETSSVTKVTLTLKSHIQLETIAATLAFHLPKEYPEQKAVICLNEAQGFSDEKRSELLLKLNNQLNELDLVNSGFVRLFEESHKSMELLALAGKQCLACEKEFADLEGIQSLHCSQLLHSGCIESADELSLECEECKKQFETLKKKDEHKNESKEEGEISDSEEELAKCEPEEKKKSEEEEEESKSTEEEKKPEEARESEEDDDKEEQSLDVTVIEKKQKDEQEQNEENKENESEDDEDDEDKDQKTVVAEATSTEDDKLKGKRNTRRQRRKRSRTSRKGSVKDMSEDSQAIGSYRSSYEHYSAQVFGSNGGRFFDRSRSSYHQNGYQRHNQYNGYNAQNGHFDPDRLLNGPRDRVGYFAARRVPVHKSESENQQTSDATTASSNAENQAENDQQQPQQEQQPQLPQDDQLSQSRNNENGLDVFAENYRSAQSAQTRRMQRSNLKQGNFVPNHIQHQPRYNNNNNNSNNYNYHKNHQNYNSYNNHYNHQMNARSHNNNNGYNNNNYNRSKPFVNNYQNQHHQRPHNQMMNNNQYMPNKNYNRQHYNNNSNNNNNGSMSYRRSGPSISYYGNYYGNVMPNNKHSDYVSKPNESRSRSRPHGESKQQSGAENQEVQEQIEKPEEQTQASKNEESHAELPKEQIISSSVSDILASVEAH